MFSTTMVVVSIATNTSRPGVLGIRWGPWLQCAPRVRHWGFPAGADRPIRPWVGLGRVVGVRLTELRGLMQAQFGPLRAPSVASDHVFSALDGRTVNEALAAGADPKVVWLAVCDDFDVSDTLRYGLPD